MKRKYLLIVLFAMILFACNKNNETDIFTSKVWRGEYLNELIILNKDGSGFVQFFQQRSDFNNNISDLIVDSIFIKWTYDAKAATGKLNLVLTNEQGKLIGKLQSKRIDSNRLEFTGINPIYTTTDLNFLPKGVGDNERRKIFNILTAGRWKLTKILIEDKESHEIENSRWEYIQFYKNLMLVCKDTLMWNLGGEAGLSLAMISNDADHFYIQELTPSKMRLVNSFDRSQKLEFIKE